MITRVLSHLQDYRDRYIIGAISFAFTIAFFAILDLFPNSQIRNIIAFIVAGIAVNLNHTAFHGE